MLEALAPHREGLPLKELAKAAGVSSAAAFHTIQTLVEHGYAERHDLRYTLGPKLLTLAATREQSTILKAVDMILEEIGKALPGSHLYFSEKIGGIVQITRQYRPGESQLVRGGHVLPPYASGGTVIHLAFWPKEVADEYEANFPFELYGLPFWRSRDAYEETLTRMKEERGGFMPERSPWRLKYVMPLFTSHGTFVGAVTVQWNHPEGTRQLAKLRQQQERIARAAASRFTNELT